MKFKRMFYYALQHFALDERNKFCALLGPKKIGKTVALKQLEDFLLQNNYSVLSLYFDIDLYPGTINEWCNKVFEAIQNKSFDFIIIDEITYVPRYDAFIKKIADMSGFLFSNTKIILSGSSEVFLRRACLLGIGTGITYVNASFLNFTEYLVYTGKLDGYSKAYFTHDSIQETIDSFATLVTIDDFNDYVINSWKFSGMSSLTEYVGNCIEENTVSNTNRVFSGGEEFANEVDVEFTIAVLCMCLCSLHDTSKWDTVIKDTNTLDEFGVKPNEKMQSDKSIDSLLSDCFIRHYVKNVSSYSFKEIKRALKALYEYHLICFQFTDSSISSGELYRWLSTDKEMLGNNKISSINEFFKYVSVMMVSPVTYAALIQDLLKKIPYDNVQKSLLDILSGSLRGSFVENFLKGIYCITKNDYCIIQHKGAHEVDLVDYDTLYMYEFSTENKSEKNVYFDDVPFHEMFTKVLTGADINKIIPLGEDEQPLIKLSYPVYTAWLDAIYYANLMHG